MFGRQQPQQAPRHVIQRGAKNPIFWIIGIASFGIMLIPGVGGAIGGFISHVTDRVKNGIEANRELKERTKYYANEIGAIVGKNPNQVKLSDFHAAAQISPSMARLYNEPLKKKQKENNNSALMNGGFAVAGALPVPGMAALAKAADGGRKIVGVAHGGAKMAVGMAGSMAGGAVGNALAQDTVEAQILLEGMEKDGKVSPELLFIVRVAQDPVTMKRIKEQMGKPINKLSPEQLTAVMESMPQLTAAVTRETHAIENGDLSIRAVGAMAPNMNGGAVARLQAQRAQTRAQGQQAVPG